MAEQAEHERIQRKTRSGETQEIEVSRGDRGQFASSSDKPKKYVIGARVDEESHAKAKKLAKREGISLSEWAGRILMAAIENAPLDDGESNAEENNAEG